MLVWETRAVKREIASGAFACPTCATDRPYRHVRAQRHGYVYWIPLISLGEAVEYVECQGCRGTFEGRILDVADDDERAEICAAYQRGMLQVMVEIRRVDRDWDGVAGVFEVLAERPLAVGELDAAIVEAEARDDDLRRYLQRLEPHLNDVGKERIVQAALFAAASDGLLDTREARQLKEVARALGVTDAQRKRIVAKLPS